MQKQATHPMCRCFQFPAQLPTQEQMEARKKRAQDMYKNSGSVIGLEFDPLGAAHPGAPFL